MSRIGKKPVKIPSGVNVELSQKLIKISGPNGNLTLDINPRVKVDFDSKTAEVKVSRLNDERESRAVHGTIRALIANMVGGVTKGYSKTLQIYGTGYGVKQQGMELLFDVGMAKPASVTLPAGVTIDVKAPNARGNDVPAEFTVKSADKCLVGEVAAKIRRKRPPEPYKGKGIRYADEVIKRKVGKAFGSA